jgi:LysR family hca operon transcriptional activator
MELRRLRYFVAAAEEGSLTVAAERIPHTSQPSMRRPSALRHESGERGLRRGPRGLVHFVFVVFPAVGGCARLGAAVRK